MAIRKRLQLIKSDNHGVNSLPEVGFVRLPTILELIPVSRSTFFEMVKRGDFARPVKLSAHVSAWRCEDVRAFIATRVSVGE